MAGRLTGVDHIVLGAADHAAAVAAYRTLFARAPSWRAAPALTSFALPEGPALEILSPGGGDDDPLAAALARDGEGLMSLAFAAQDLDALARRWTQIGLAPHPIAPGASRDLDSGAERAWRRTRAGETPGVRVFALEGAAPLAPGAAEADAPVDGLDHLVIRTPAPERALAFYGAKLGLDLRMDRTFPELGGARMLFFRAGLAILEVVHEPGAAGDGPDRLWGATWRVADVAAARARLLAAGVAVSEVRAGRKPGTRVATVRSGTCGAPTLLLEPAGPA